MITKREKLQYVYVFLTDLAALAASVILAWLIVGGIMGQLLPYSVLDWVQALVLLVLAYTVTFFCFDQTENIVKRTRGQEAKLSIKSNLLMMVIYSAFLTLSKAVLQDSRYFLVGVVSFNLFLLPAAHGLLKKLLVKAPDSLQNETLVGIVTTGDHAGKMIREISNDWSRRVCGVALLEATGDAIGTKVENIEIKANYDTFMNWLRRAALDEVYIDVPMDSGESFIPYLEEMESMGLTVHFRMPLLDRIDLHIEVPSVDYEAMRRKDTPECSRDIQRRVNAARAVQQARYAGTEVSCNAYMTPPMIGKYCVLDEKCEKIMHSAFDRLGLTGRSHDRILRVARTIADLDGSEHIRPEHIAEAIQYRSSSMLK